MGWCRAEIVHEDSSRTVVEYGVDPLADPPKKPQSATERSIEYADDWTHVHPVFWC